MIRTLTNGQWKQFIIRLAGIFEKGDTMLHEGGCIALDHCSKFFDARRMVELYQCTGKTTRKVGFLVWVHMFSPIRITDTKANGVTVKVLRPTDEGYVPFDLVGAEARPFWTLEEANEKVTAPLSVDGVLKVLNAYKGKVAKAKTGKYVVEGNVIKLESTIEDAIALVSQRKRAIAEQEALEKLAAAPVAAPIVRKTAKPAPVKKVTRKAA